MAWPVSAGVQATKQVFHTPFDSDPEVPVSPETATFCLEGTLKEEQGAYGPSLPADKTMFIPTEGLQTVYQSSRHNDKRFVPTL